MAGSEVSDRNQGSPKAETAHSRSAQGVAGRRDGLRHRLLAVALPIIGFLPVGHAQGGPDPPPIDELVTSLQAKYDSVRDYSADFEHRYEGGVLRTSLVESGTVLVKKPGRMRWAYTTPEEKLFVSDGETMYSYIPVDRQVMVGEVPPEDRASTPVLFLTGKGRLARDFSASYDELPHAPPNSWVLRLTPRAADADYEWLTIAVDRQALSITQLVATDFQGGISTFTFSNLEENTGLSDREFAFEIPRGTEVITAESFPQ